MSLPIILFYGFAFLGIVHSLIFSTQAIRNKNTADLILTIFLFAQSLIILEYIFFWTGIDKTYHQLSNLSLPIQLLFGPLLMMLVDYIFAERKSGKYYFYHFMPAITAFILMLPYYFSNADLKLNHYKIIPYFILNLKYFNYFIMAHMTGYFIWLLIKNIKSKRVGHIHNWLLMIICCYGFYVASYLSYYAMVLQPWFTLQTDYFVSVGMCASIIAIIYFAYGKKNILNGYPVNESVDIKNVYLTFKEQFSTEEPNKNAEQRIKYNYAVPILPEGNEELNDVEVEESINAPQLIAIKYKNSGLTEETGREISERLKLLMQQKRLYRESEVKLETLASILGVKRHLISQIINQYYGVNYFEYINVLRIEEAKQLLITSGRESMNVIEIAYQVGYNTKNTFNTAFRRITGMTPTEYRNQYQLRMN